MKLTPARGLLIGYVSLIILGAVLLSLPMASTGKRCSLIDSFFTSASSVCVTGLIVKDTPKDFSLFGQAVILFLIQIGGLGYMTTASILFLFLRRRFSMRQSIITGEGVSFFSIGGVRPFIARIFQMTFAMELIGVVLLSLRFSRLGYARLTALHLGLFHSISAFCNAGFSLFSNSFISFSKDPWILFTISTLFIIGGLGFITMREIKRKLFKPRHIMSLHAKIALATTIIFLIGGTFLFFVIENNGILKGYIPVNKLLISYFQAATPRTAGFTAVALKDIRPTTNFLLCLFMFIGASPGGTGGGIKTVTFAVILLSTIAYLRGKSSVTVFNRRLREVDINRSFYIFIIGIGVIFFGLFIIGLGGMPLSKILFEEFSAFGTVGLSLGSINNPAVSLSYNFSLAGKIVIILTMIAGRVGPLTLGLAFLEKPPKGVYKFSEERVQVG
jgi:trk system potassium uptake protein TrkH